jgi:hypothetical protein
VAVLTGYEYHNSATPPGNVCSSFSFLPAPSGAASAFGSFTLRVYPVASLSANLASASPGTTITFTGSGFVPMEDVSVHVGSVDSPGVQTPADGNGSMSLSLRQPQAPYGAHDVYALGETSGKLGATSVFVTPVLRVTPRTATAGSQVVVSGAGFGASEQINIYWGNPRQLLGSATARGAGSFSGNAGLTITIPANAPPGRNGLAAVGQSTGAIAVGEIRVQ